MLSTPIHPGAMTPAQMLNRALTAAAAVLLTAATVAAMLTTTIIFN